MARAVREKKKLTTIYLVRHGEVQNPKVVFYGRLSGFPLSQKGIKQAEELGRYFSGKNIAAVYSSPLLRTYQTAEFIAKPHNLHVQNDERAIEVRSTFDGKSRMFLYLLGRKAFSPFFEDASHVALRMISLLKDIIKAHGGKEVVVVSHGGPISITPLFLQGKKINPRDWHRTSIASVTKIVLGPDLKIYSFGYYNNAEHKN